MKFLILSTATGEGHNSAAAALRESLCANGCEVVVLDVLNSGKSNASSGVSHLYSRMTLFFPGFFGLLYHIGELVSSSRHHSPIYYLNALYAGGLYQKIQCIQPDCILCTHIFSAQAVTRLREKYALSIPAAGIMTDYTCSPFWEETRLDSYVIPAKELTEEFVRKGIPREKLIPFGIPIRAPFRTKGNQEEARRKLGLDAKHVFVIAGGSMGYGSIRKFAVSLTERIPGAQAAVLCGNNQKLYQKLSGIRNVHPFGYTDRIDLFMDAADALLTKPGGLTTSEALAKRVPLVLTCPIPGCEEKNANFIASLGAAVTAKNTEEAVKAARRLADSPEAAQSMRAQQRLHFERENTEKMAKHLIHMVQSNGSYNTQKLTDNGPSVSGTS